MEENTSVDILSDQTLTNITQISLDRNFEGTFRTEDFEITYAARDELFDEVENQFSSKSKMDFQMLAVFIITSLLVFSCIAAGIAIWLQYLDLLSRDEKLNRQLEEFETQFEPQSRFGPIKW